MSEDEMIHMLQSYVGMSKKDNHRPILDKAIETILDLYQQEKEKNKKLKNQAKMSAEEHGRVFDKLEKMIDLLIEDLQMEGCLVDMTQEEIYRYYEKRILLEEQ